MDKKEPLVTDPLNAFGEGFSVKIPERQYHTLYLYNYYDSQLVAFDRDVLPILANVKGLGKVKVGNIFPTRRGRYRIEYFGGQVSGTLNKSPLGSRVSSSIHPGDYITLGEQRYVFMDKELQIYTPKAPRSRNDLMVTGERGELHSKVLDDAGREDEHKGDDRCAGGCDGEEASGEPKLSGVATESAGGDDGVAETMEGLPGSKERKASEEVTDSTEDSSEGMVIAKVDESQEREGQRKKKRGNKHEANTKTISQKQLNTVISRSKLESGRFDPEKDTLTVSNAFKRVYALKDILGRRYHERFDESVMPLPASVVKRVFEFQSRRREAPGEGFVVPDSLREFILITEGEMGKLHIRNFAIRAAEEHSYRYIRVSPRDFLGAPRVPKAVEVGQKAVYFGPTIKTVDFDKIWWYYSNGHSLELLSVVEVLQIFRSGIAVVRKGENIYFIETSDLGPVDPHFGVNDLDQHWFGKLLDRLLSETDTPTLLLVEDLMAFFFNEQRPLSILDTFCSFKERYLDGGYSHLVVIGTLANPQTSHQKKEEQTEGPIGSHRSSKKSNESQKVELYDPDAPSSSPSKLPLLDDSYFFSYVYKKINSSVFKGRRNEDALRSMLRRLFPNHIDKYIGDEEANERAYSLFMDLSQIERAYLSMERNFFYLTSVLSVKGLDLEEDFDPAILSHGPLKSSEIEELVFWAMVRQQDIGIPRQAEGPLKLSNRAVLYGIKQILSKNKFDKEQWTLRRVLNRYETDLLDSGVLVRSHEIDVTFDDIGGLEHAMDTIRESIVLPLERPGLFSRGSLGRVSKGILLYGPPGTGKSTIAKAIANWSGANFLNISVTNISSVWYGESEKYAAAVFSLARKLSPAIIFLDEIDHLLGQRSSGSEHEVTRQLKNIILENWDGAKNRPFEKVMVIGATNRPFDLDDAVLRRFSRKLYIDLPNSSGRVHILKILLANDEVEDGFDYHYISSKLEGYSGSDIRDVAVAARQISIREAFTKGLPTKRKITQKDFEEVIRKVKPSTSPDSEVMSKLREWNEKYGEGSSRNRSLQFNYYL